MTDYRQLYEQERQRNSRFKDAIDYSLDNKDTTTIVGILKRFISNIRMELGDRIPGFRTLDELVSDLFRYVAQRWESRVHTTGLMSNFANPTGMIESVWVDHNVTQNGQYGMYIHTKFSVQNMQGCAGNLSIYFYLNDGRPLIDFHSSHHSDEGQVATGEEFTPPYSNSTYNDYSLFMPYDAFRLTSGKHTLRYQVSLFNDVTPLDDSETFSFTMTI